VTALALAALALAAPTPAPAQEAVRPAAVAGQFYPADAERLRGAGVRRVYTPKDFDLTGIMGEIVGLVDDVVAFGHALPRSSRRSASLTSVINSK